MPTQRRIARPAKRRNGRAGERRLGWMPVHVAGASLEEWEAMRELSSPLWRYQAVSGPGPTAERFLKEGPQTSAVFTVLSADIMEIPASEILRTRCAMTIIGGVSGTANAGGGCLGTSAVPSSENAIKRRVCAPYAQPSAAPTSSRVPVAPKPTRTARYCLAPTR